MKIDISKYDRLTLLFSIIIIAILLLSVFYTISLIQLNRSETPDVTLDTMSSFVHLSSIESPNDPVSQFEVKFPSNQDSDDLTSIPSDRNISIFNYSVKYTNTPLTAIETDPLNEYGNITEMKSYFAVSLMDTSGNPLYNTVIQTINNETISTTDYNGDIKWKPSQQSNFKVSPQLYNSDLYFLTWGFYYEQSFDDGKREYESVGNRWIEWDNQGNVQFNYQTPQQFNLKYSSFNYTTYIYNLFSILILASYIYYKKIRNN